MTAERATDVVHKCFDAFAVGDLETLRALLNPDARWSRSRQDGAVTELDGANDIVAYLADAMLRTGGTLRVEIEDLYIDGATSVVSTCAITGEHLGTRFAHRQAFVIGVSDGRVASVRELSGRRDRSPV
jgi:ketosteroid isomerase-like protein